MKKTDLAKNQGLKVMGKMRQAATPDRYAQGSAEPALDRRAQRKLDQEQGLIPFPVKLKQPLADRIRARSSATGVPVNELVAALLEKALGAAGEDPGNPDTDDPGTDK